VGFLGKTEKTSFANNFLYNDVGRLLGIRTKSSLFGLFSSIARYLPPGRENVPPDAYRKKICQKNPKKMFLRFSPKNMAPSRFFI
jgi:hypothetical protein